MHDYARVRFGDLSVLVAGCGSIGSRHARNVRALGVRGLDLFDPDAARTAQLTQELGARALDNLDAALERGPDAVLVCTPSASHLPIARRALANGAHVFVEKPLASALDEVPLLLADADASGRTVMVGY